LIATADTSIYTINDSTFLGALGTGRLDVYRAVSEASPILIQAVEFTPSDADGGDDDGMLEPGEVVKIEVTLKSYLQSLSSVRAALKTDDPYVTIVDGASVFPAWAADSTASNAGDLFSIQIAANAPPSHTANLFLVISDDGGTYRRLELHPILILPLYDDHDTGNVKLTLTSFGALGFYDYINEREIGSGFQYPIGAPSPLFHGSLMAGTASDRVSDCSYGNEFSSRFDWRVFPGGVLSVGQGVRSDQDGLAAYSDSGATNPISLKVVQTSMAFRDPPNDDFVIVEYRIENLKSEAINGLYVGLYMDWDFEASDGSAGDQAGWDAANALGYMYGPASSYYGIALLNEDPTSYRAVLNPGYIWNGFTDANKYLFMTEGFQLTTSNEVNDWSQLLSAGPIDLPVGGGVILAFAVLGGNDLDDLKANAAAAKAAYATGIDDAEEKNGALPERLTLGQNYPNPFNNSTIIPFSLPEAGEVHLDIYNLSGQRVKRLTAGRLEPGNHRVSWNGRDDRGADAPSGIYMARLKGMGGSRVIKLLYLK
jgi:hypothetical protein